MTNLTRLRLILVDLSGLMKKKTRLKESILFYKLNYLKLFIMTNLTRLRLILVDLSGLMKKKHG